MTGVQTCALPICPFLLLSLLVGYHLPSHAQALAALSSKDAASGLETALAQCADRAVQQLGAPDGFLKNAKVAIPLPPAFQKVDAALRLFGRAGTPMRSRPVSTTPLRTP